MGGLTLARGIAKKWNSLKAACCAFCRSASEPVTCKSMYKAAFCCRPDSFCSGSQVPAQLARPGAYAGQILNDDFLSAITSSPTIEALAAIDGGAIMCPNRLEGLRLCKPGAGGRGEEAALLRDVVIVTCGGIDVGPFWHALLQVGQPSLGPSSKFLRISKLRPRKVWMCLNPTVPMD